MDPADALALLMSPEGRVDPYPTYEVLRAHGPVVQAGPVFFVVTGYAEADAILRDTLRCFDHGAIEEGGLTAFNLVLDQFHAAVADRKAVLFSLPQNLQRTSAQFRAAGNA